MTITIAPPHVQIGNDKIADRLFWEAQRALRIERNPLGIGRKVEPGALDIVALVKGGGLTNKAINGRGDACREGGHALKCVGGANAGCSKDCHCSVPVHECRCCHYCDHGDNVEANDIRKNCEFREVGE